MFLLFSGFRRQVWLPRRPDRAGFSLTELLVASTIGLMLIAAVASLFALLGNTFSQSRSTIDMAARMRAASWKLRQDLAGITCPVVPWVSPDMNAGYFEYIEGQRRDTFAAAGTGNLEADTDDILMFTTQALEGSFVGRCGPTTGPTQLLESPYAEVAWFCRPAAEQAVQGTTLYNLYRRQLLVLGYVGLGEFQNPEPQNPDPQRRNSIQRSLPAAYVDYDLSMRSVGGWLVPQTLGDLTKRENRFMHGPVFPHHVQVDPSSGRLIEAATFDKTDRVWEDVILTNVISFDVRAYDSAARAQIAVTPDGPVVRFPGDPGYGTGTGAFGAYLGIGQGQGGRLSAGPDPKSRLSPLPANAVVYDTWSPHYEFTAPGRSGFNDVSQYTVLPPYPLPLRAVEVRIRCYEPRTKQVRQVTVRQAFRGS